MPSSTEELKRNPEHRAEAGEALRQSLADRDGTWHEDFVEGVKQTNAKEHIVAEAEEKMRATRDSINTLYEKGTLVDDKKALERTFKEAHLTEDDFKNIPEWNALTREQKMLVVEQASQDILANVQKIGEERFETKNKISFKGENKDSVGSAVKKIWNKTWKSVYISKEEKDTLHDVEAGRIKPSEETLRRIAQKTKDMDLTVTEKNGKAFIEFVNADKNSREEEKQIIERFNEIADKFSRMPDAWKNEQSSKSTDKSIKGNTNYKKYESLQKEYSEVRDELIKEKQLHYEKQSSSKREALKKALVEVSQIDHKIAMLQFENTNPDAIAELTRIKNESSWGRMLNNETAWRGIYMGSGWVARSVAVTTLGAMTGPLVASIIGGSRARRKANQEINKAVAEGRKTETFRERKQEGKSGLFDDKNKQVSTLGAVLSGSKANAKEVANFVDADSQIQRLDNLIKKIETTPEKDRQELLLKLKERLSYIQQKGDQGLINFGSQNPGALNYQLLTFMSKAVMYAPENLQIAHPNETPVEKAAREKLKAEMDRRNALLEKVITDNEERVKNKQSNFKTKEMIRGAMIGAGFSALGWQIRNWFHATPNNVDIRTGDNHTDEFAPRDDTYVKPPLVRNPENLRPGEGPNPFPKTEIPPIIPEVHKPIEIQLSSKGSIQTFLDLKQKLSLEYGKDLAHTPESVQHILNTNATKLAEEFNMYNPTDVDESMMAPKGSTFNIDEKGNFSYHEAGAQNGTVLEEGTSAKGTGEYKGKMFDYDKAKTLKVETAQNVGTSTPETPQTNTGNIPSQEAGAPAQGLHQSIDDIFPSDQEVRDGIARDHFRSLVNSHYENIQGEEWKNLPQADKNAEVWMGEKFGKVNVGQKADGTPTIGDFIEPSQNLGIDLKSVPVAEAIKANTTVASGIADLQKIARTQLGYDMVIDKNESTSSYIHRVFTALESASQEQPEAPALEEEINRMGRPGKILPGDYMADQSQEEYMGETSVNQTETPASEANNAGEDGGLGKAEKGPGTGKVYTETLEETKNPIKWEKYRDHKIITTDDVKGRNEVIGISPNTNDRGITYRDWNRVFDNKIVDPEADNVKFGSYNQYETERELQLLFGKGEKIGNTINMSYFREQPEWKTVSKVPARYFFNELFGNEYVSHYPREISDAQLEILKKAGLIRDVNVVDPTTGAVTRSIQFTHHAELARLAQAYRHINPNEAQPYPNETIEDYVSRLMKKVHQTQDGSFFARKHDINFDEAGQSIQQQGPTQQMPVYTPDNPGIISPTRGIYNTGGVPPISPTRGVYNDGSMFGPSGYNYGPSYGQQGYGYAPGFNTGSRQGDVIVGGAQVAQTAINEGLAVATGNASGGGGKRILNSAVQNGVQIGVNEIMRQIFGGRGGGYYGGGSNWQ